MQQNLAVTVLQQHGSDDSSLEARQLELQFSPQCVQCFSHFFLAPDRQNKPLSRYLCHTQRQGRLPYLPSQTPRCRRLLPAEDIRANQCAGLHIQSFSTQIKVSADAWKLVVLCARMSNPDNILVAMSDVETQKPIIEQID